MGGQERGGGGRGVAHFPSAPPFSLPIPLTLFKCPCHSYCNFPLIVRDKSNKITQVFSDDVTGSVDQFLLNSQNNITSVRMNDQ